MTHLLEGESGRMVFNLTQYLPVKSIIPCVFLCFVCISRLYAFPVNENNKHAEAVKVYTVGIVPQFEARKLYAIWKPIIDELESRSGLKFKLMGSSSITEFEKKLLAGEFDFAYMNPFHSVMTKKSKGYIPLVRDHSKKLQGILVVHKDSALNNIKQLEGKVIAFPAPNALGASLMVRAELANQYKINFIPRYVKTHDSVYLNVVYKKTVAGGGVQKTLQHQNPAIKNQLRVLYRTQTSAPHPFGVHPRIDKHIADQVQRALLEMSNSNESHHLLLQVPIKKIGTANYEDYIPLLKMGLDKVYSADGL